MSRQTHPTLFAAALFASAVLSAAPVHPLTIAAGEASPAATATPAKVPSAASALSQEDQEALELGRKVAAVKRAIADPTAPGALKAVTALGHDSRYYVMVRGWLSQQLAGDQGIADARGADTPKPVRDRISFLKKAIRAIDLE